MALSRLRFVPSSKDPAAEVKNEEFTSAFTGNGSCLIINLIKNKTRIIMSFASTKGGRISKHFHVLSACLREVLFVKTMSKETNATCAFFENATGQRAVYDVREFSKSRPQHIVENQNFARARQTTTCY